MKSKETIELENIATYDKDDKKANKAMRKLREIDPSYHWCPEWDFLVICDSDREANCCTCE